MNRAIVILGAATLAFGSASAYLYNDLRDTRAETAALQARVAELQKQAGLPAKAASSASRDVPINPFGPAVPGSPPPARSPATTPPAPTATFAAVSGSGGQVIMNGVTAPMIRNGWERRNRMLENPEYRDAMKRQQRLMLPRMYPDLRSALQLDEQRADQLYDLLAEKQMKQMVESRPPFLTDGAAPDPTAIRDWQAQQEQARRETETAIANVIGENGLQQWKDYENSLPARSQVRELRSTFENAGIPLRQDQSEQLVTAFAAEQKRALTEAQAAYQVTYGNSPVAGSRIGQLRASGASPDQMIEAQKQQQQNLRMAVSPILTSQQMRELERVHASQLEMFEISIKMSRAAQAEMEARGGNTNGLQGTAAVGFITER